MMREQWFLSTVETLISLRSDNILTAWHNIVKVDTDEQAIKEMENMTEEQAFDLLQFTPEVFDSKFVMFFEELDDRRMANRLVGIQTIFVEFFRRR